MHFLFVPKAEPDSLSVIDYNMEKTMSQIEVLSLQSLKRANSRERVGIDQRLTIRKFQILSFLRKVLKKEELHQLTS